jgi:hypothetical protein
MTFLKSLCFFRLNLSSVVWLSLDFKSSNDVNFLTVFMIDKSVFALLLSLI